MLTFSDDEVTFGTRPDLLVLILGQNVTLYSGLNAEAKLPIICVEYKIILLLKGGRNISVPEWAFDV